jgi:peptidyl-prolyl cis-trans isomerase D
MALRLMREWMKYLKWILWFVVATFIIALFFDFGSINQFGRASGQVAVSVGDEEITYSEFRRSYQNLESRYRQMLGESYSADMIKRFNLPQQALDQLINRRILLLEADRIGILATDAEVKQAILDYPVFQDASGKFIGRQRVKDILRQNQMSEQEFADAVREDVVLEKLNSVLAQTAYLSEADLEKAWRDQNEKAKLRYVYLPASVVAATPVTVADGELQAYFDQNTGKYRLAERRVADYVLVDTGKLRAEMKIDDAELRANYEQNRKEYERPDQIKARHILLRVKPERDDAATAAAANAALARIRGGEDFANVARQLSDDESNAGRGGDLGYFGRGQMVKPFDDAAWNAQVGELVGPVKTDFGYHLIQVQEKQAAGVQPFEQVQAAIRARLINERVPQVAEARAKEVARKLAEAKVKTPEEMKAFAEKEGLTFETTQPFGRDDNATGIGRSVDFNAAVFEKLSGDKISDPIKIPRGWAIARLNKVEAPRRQELSEVREKVRSEVLAQKHRAMAKSRLDAVRGQVAAGQKDLAAAAKDLGVEVKESDSVSRTANIEGVGSAQPLVEAALGMEVGALSLPVETKEGAVLFEVLERNRFEKSTFETQKAEIRKGEEEKRLGQLTTALIEQRRRDLAPQVDAQLVEEFGLQSNPAARG